MNGFKVLMITLPPTKRYIPDTMLFESQMNINNTNTTLTDNMSMEISYNDTSSSNKIVKDFFNNATFVLEILAMSTMLKQLLILIG